MDPDAFLAAVETLSNEQLARHEAEHAAAAMLQGLVVREVRAPFWTLDELEHGDPSERAGYALIERRPGADGTRKAAIATLAPRVWDPYWPPKWPLTPAPADGDERDLIEHVKALGLDREGYDALVADTRALTNTAQFERLAVAISHLLEQRGTLDERGLTMVKAIAEGQTVETKRLSVPVTDTTTLTEGEMLALASTFGNVDLQGDRVMPGAFTETVRSIKAGASLPLIWGHDAHGSPQNFVGQIIDADETDEGLQVHARFDLEDPVARKAWKLVRDGSIDKLSIGYSIPNGGRRRGRDGANELHKVNLFEVSLVLTPANDHARVLAVKSADNLDHVRDEWRSTMRTYLAAADADALREKAMRITRECEPIQVATFDA